MSRVLRCNTAIVSVDSEVMLRTNCAPSPSLLHFSLDCTSRWSEYRSSAVKYEANPVQPAAGFVCQRSNHHSGSTV
ncbi:MAG: hypothetical protein BroJett001_33510 [Chloroflexota bacterium]|nr:MAG: hypothetical protein BroJett001_33510 [Chloroflexota bacterium]